MNNPYAKWKASIEAYRNNNMLVQEAMKAAGSKAIEVGYSIIFKRLLPFVLALTAASGIIGFVAGYLVGKA